MWNMIPSLCTPRRSSWHPLSPNPPCHLLANSCSPGSCAWASTPSDASPTTPPRPRPRPFPTPRPGHLLQLLRALRLDAPELGPPRRRPHPHPPQASCGAITLLVDDTLAHKRGKSVWGLGWFRDAVASTKKRVATASGHNWVVLAVAVCLPFTKVPILALPLLARLHLPGKGQPSCADLAKEMLAEVLGWWPGRRFTLVGDGAYATQGLAGRPGRAGDLRGAAAWRRGRLRPACAAGDEGPAWPQGEEGAEAAQAEGGGGESGPQADDERGLGVAGGVGVGLRLSRGRCRRWPTRWCGRRVLGYRRLQVVVVRDPSGRMRDAYLFTTDLEASLSWVITQFAWRWAIEVLFRASKQVLDIEAPQQWSRESVEKVAPWVWSMQSVVMVWYITAGYESAEAAELRERAGGLGQ